MTVTVRARAKLNLFLKVHPPLASGLHPIEGVFASISLVDEVAVDTRETPGINFVTDFDFDCPAEENLCVRAARAFLEAIEEPGHGAEIRLDKQIPVFAGLGGGSADAAAVLVALNRAYGEPLSTERLAELGAGLGSDVPFCLSGGLAMVTGTGSEVRSLGQPPVLNALVLKPPCSVQTAWAYRAFDTFPDKAGESDLDGLTRALREGDAAGVATRLYNSFEPVVEAQYPVVRHAREQLLWAGALGARLSGSGSAVYGIFPDSSACQDAASRLSGRYPTWACTLEPRGIGAAQ